MTEVVMPLSEATRRRKRYLQGLRRQWRAPEEDSEEQGAPGHCIRAEGAKVYSKEQTVVEVEVPLWLPSNQARITENGRRERTRGPVGAAGDTVAFAGSESLQTRAVTPRRLPKSVETCVVGCEVD